jgi:putative ABC transport system substrate-binding protein
VKPTNISFAVVVAFLLLVAPLVVEAQPAARVWTIGYLAVGPPERSRGHDSFVEGLRALGYVEGQNLRIERRFANNKAELLPGLAAELARLRVAVIVAGDSRAIGPAKEATKSIPIVMTVSADPVGDGLIASLAHPGGNVTGLTNISPDLAGKRLQLLREALPRFSRVAVLGPRNVSDWRELTALTDALGVQLQRLEVRAPDEFERAFKAATEGRADGLLVLPSPLTNPNAKRLVRLAAERRLPVMYPLSHYAEIGGLMAYGPNIPDMHRRAAVYVDKILKGAKPAKLPVEQPTKFELVINLKTAKALGLTISPSLLLQADRVVE